MMATATVKPFDPLDSSLECDPFTWLQKVFCYFLQGFFEHENFQGTGMHWVRDEGPDDDHTTEMVITSEKPRISVLEKVPHIVVVLGAGQFANLSLDQLLSMQMRDGQRTHTDLFPMTMSYHCQAKEGLLARRMSWYAAWGTVAMRRMIMRQGRLHNINPGLQLSSETGPTAYTGQLTTEEVTSVVVTVSFYWQPGWTIRKPAPELKSIEGTLRYRSVAELTADQAFCVVE